MFNLHLIYFVHTCQFYSYIELSYFYRFFYVQNIRTRYFIFFILLTF